MSMSSRTSTTAMPKKQKPVDPEFPCSLLITTPFPSHRLASSALQALQVDAELSPMVRRSFSLVPSRTASSSSSASSSASSSPTASPGSSQASSPTDEGPPADKEAKTLLQTEYRAKSNRMLRVAVNGYMESLGVVLGVMERLDRDVVGPKRPSS